MLQFQILPQKIASSQSPQKKFEPDLADIVLQIGLSILTSEKILTDLADVIIWWWAFPKVMGPLILYGDLLNQALPIGATVMGLLVCFIDIICKCQTI